MMNSKLESIPPSLCSLTNLYRLGLKSNSLRKLPEEFGGLKGLVELFLTDNMLTCLPDSICECSQLVKLQVCARPQALFLQGPSARMWKQKWLNWSSDVASA
jgi:hypothetical protein